MMTGWLLPWDPSWLAISSCFAAGFFYWKGSLIVQSLFWRKICFWSGLLSLYLIWQSGFDYYAEHEFFMGRIQQGTLQHFAPFLLALSAPAITLSAGLPEAVKLNWRVPGFLVHPFFSALLFNGLMLVWLIPSVHFVTMLDWRLYHLMNISMVLSGLLFWSIAFSSRYSTATRIVMMLTAIPPQIILGAVLTFAAHDLYSVYAVCGRALFSLSPLQDQQIGGLIIWIHGAMMSIIGILIVARHAFRQP